MGSWGPGEGRVWGEVRWGGVYGQGCLGVRSAPGGMQEEMRGKGGKKGAPTGGELERSS